MQCLHRHRIIIEKNKVAQNEKSNNSKWILIFQKHGAFYQA